MNDLTEGYYCAWTESDGRHSLRFGSLDEAKAKCDAVRASRFDCGVFRYERSGHELSAKRVWPPREA